MDIGTSTPVANSNAAAGMTSAKKLPFHLQVSYFFIFQNVGSSYYGKSLIEMSSEKIGNRLSDIPTYI